MFSATPVTRRGNYLDTLCATLEEKMMYGKGERDMVMLQHKFEVELKDGTKVNSHANLQQKKEKQRDGKQSTTKRTKKRQPRSALVFWIMVVFICYFRCLLLFFGGPPTCISYLKRIVH